MTQSEITSVCSHLTGTDHRELEFTWSVSANKCLSEEVATKSQKRFGSQQAHRKSVPILRDLWYMGKKGWRRARKMSECISELRAM